jgi:hypothetical protein
MRRGAPGGLWSVLLAVLCTCQALPARAQQPAVLTQQNARTLAQLNRLISDALHGTPVRLAGDALTHDSVLIIEPVTPRDAAGLPLNGRELGRPEHFQLLKHGTQCLLVQQSTGRRWSLSASCAPLSPTG